MEIQANNLFLPSFAYVYDKALNFNFALIIPHVESSYCPLTEVQYTTLLLHAVALAKYSLFQ